MRIGSSARCLTIDRPVGVTTSGFSEEEEEEEEEEEGDEVMERRGGEVDERAPSLAPPFSSRVTLDTVTRSGN